jgi:transcriptional repressor NrdR
MEQTSRLMVIKKDGTHVPFESERILRGIQSACGKRPIDEDRKLAIVRDVEDAIHREYEREIESAEIGRRVARHLRDIDQVAWVRYASEYLSFQTLDDVEEAISEIRNAPPPVEGQSTLFPEQ